jgi:ribosome modulation factor
MRKRKASVEYRMKMRAAEGKRKTEIFNSGYNACLARISKNNCPHLGSDREQWIGGWDFCCQEKGYS